MSCSLHWFKNIKNPFAVLCYRLHLLHTSVIGISENNTKVFAQTTNCKPENVVKSNCATARPHASFLPLDLAALLNSLLLLVWVVLLTTSLSTVFLPSFKSVNHEFWFIYNTNFLMMNRCWLLLTDVTNYVLLQSLTRFLLLFHLPATIKARERWYRPSYLWAFL